MVDFDPFWYGLTKWEQLNYNKKGGIQMVTGMVSWNVKVAFFIVSYKIQEKKHVDTLVYSRLVVLSQTL